MSAAWAPPRFFELRRDLQPPQGVVPHPFEHAGEWPQCLRVGAVEAMAVLSTHRYHASFCERPQVQRYRTERDVRHRTGNLAGRELAIPDQPENLPSPRRHHHREKSHCGLTRVILV